MQYGGWGKRWSIAESRVAIAKTRPMFGRSWARLEEGGRELGPGGGWERFFIKKTVRSPE